MIIRKTVSVFAFLNFFMVLLTSIVLYIVPHGRVAYWANWQLWGLSKDQWGAIHINCGLFFLLALAIHIYFNWKPLVFYIRDRARRIMGGGTRELYMAAGLLVLCVAGTHFQIAPFSTILRINETIKAAAAKKYGEPPYGHAELSSIRSFCMKMGIDAPLGLQNIKTVGFSAHSLDQTLKEIADANNVAPQVIYLAMKPDNRQRIVRPKKETSLPESPPTGMGNLALADLCSRYDLDAKKVVMQLATDGIQADKEMTIKQIAMTSKMSPMDVYEKIQQIAQAQKIFWPIADD